MQTYLILHNIRSAQNVGAIFRTADAAGVDKIFLTGYTPRPVDKFGRSSSQIAKAALGAEKSVAWEAQVSLSRLLTKLHHDGVKVIALEQDKIAVDYKKIKPGRQWALIVGNEIEGIPKSILRSCDVVAEIPMAGQKESLNVAVALGIALFRLKAV